MGALAALPLAALISPAASHAEGLVPAVVDGPFLRPADRPNAEPRWGLRDGLAVGLHPLPGPRGLLRIYAPYLGHDPWRMINFIAVEPVVEGRRGYSELEVSPRDEAPGLGMWSGDTRGAILAPRPNLPAARGVRGRLPTPDGMVETCTVFVGVERFASGAQPYLKLLFREDRLYEVEIRVFATPDSAVMQSCILTATMGNFIRARRLHLADALLSVAELWPDPAAFGPHFAPPVTVARERLRMIDGERWAAISSDEADPAAAIYDPSVFAGWHYYGRPAVQTWRADDQPGLLARVNARAVYWASTAPIPGGPSIENFELEAPFVAGQRFVFGVWPAEAAMWAPRPPNPAAP